MAQFHVLLDLENRLYDLMVKNPTKENEFVVDELLKKEHSIYNNMTKEELNKTIAYLQQSYLHQELNERDQAIFVRFARQLDFLSRFYEMQENSSLTVFQVMYLGLNSYVREIADDYLFYQNFYRHFHKNLSSHKLNDYLFSFLYASSADVKKKFSLPLTEEDFLYREECTSILLSNFQSYFETYVKNSCQNKELVESYLKLFPKYLSSYLYSIVKDNKPMLELLKKYDFEDYKDLSQEELSTYIPGEIYTFEQIRKYQDCLEIINEKSKLVLPYLKNAFYQILNGDSKDVEEAYLYVLKYVLEEEKVISEVLNKVDDCYAFKRYVENTQFRDFKCSIPLVLSLESDSNEVVSSMITRAIFLKRILKKISKEIDMHWREYNTIDYEDEEDDYSFEREALHNDVCELQFVQEIILAYLKKEISQEEFLEELEDFRDEKENDDTPSYEEMKSINTLYYLTKLLWDKRLSPKLKEQLLEVCATLIYMEDLDREAVKVDFKNFKLYKYDGKEKASKQIFTELEAMANKEKSVGVNACIEKSYINGIYQLMSDDDKRKYLRKKQKALSLKRKK